MAMEPSADEAHGAREKVLRDVLTAIEHIDQIVMIASRSDNRLVAAEQISDRLGLSESAAHVILDLQIFRLTRQHRAQVEAELRGLEDGVAAD